MILLKLIFIKIHYCFGYLILSSGFFTRDKVIHIGGGDLFNIEN